MVISNSHIFVSFILIVNNDDEVELLIESDFCIVRVLLNAH